MEPVVSVQVNPAVHAGLRASWKAWTLVTAVTLQVAVPGVLLLTQDAPARFAFPMYAGQGHVDVVIEGVNGMQLPFDSTKAIAGFRPEMNWYDHLPAYLCRTVPGAKVVTVSQKGHESRLTCQ